MEAPKYEDYERRVDDQGEPDVPTFTIHATDPRAIHKLRNIGAPEIVIRDFVAYAASHPLTEEA